jgi:hypothetical protein
MARAPLFGLLFLAAACASTPKSKTSAEVAKESGERVEPEEPPPLDPNAEPLFTAATQVCRLIERKDDGILAIAFVPGFFDTTPPAKLDAALYEIRGALGLCSSHMVVVERVSPLEGVVAVECEHGVLMLSMGLGTAAHRPIATLGIEPRPGSTMRDLRAHTPPQ